MCPEINYQKSAQQSIRYKNYLIRADFFRLMNIKMNINERKYLKKVSPNNLNSFTKESKENTKILNKINEQKFLDEN